MGTRRETVVLTLEDHFSGAMAKAAAQTALVDKELDHLSGRAVESSAATRDLDRDVDRLGTTSSKTSKEVDKLSGRLGIARDAAILLGPALVSTGAVGTAAIAGLTSQFGFAAAGAGTAILAFQGVGDALKAVNKAALDPTKENLAAAQLAMGGLSSDARSFVRELSQLMPTLLDLRDVAAAGLLPGVGEGLKSLQAALPAVERVIGSISSELGQIAADTGASFASERWAPFLEFIATEAPYALHNLALAIGNTTHALAELWMATTPINDGFSEWLVRATEDLDKWAEGVSKTQGFQEFVDYIDKTGPQVAATIGAIANTFLQVAEAAAPLGGPVLKGLEAVANIISSIADSNLGTPIFAAIAALTAYNRALQVTASLQKTAFGKSISQGAGFIGGSLKGATGVKTLTSDLRAMRQEYSRLGPVQAIALSGFSRTTDAAKRTSETVKGLGKGSALVGGLALATSGLADEMGISNTVSLAMAGTIAGPWGAAVGAGVGAVLDLKNATKSSTEDLQRFQDVLLATAQSKVGADLGDQITYLQQRLIKSLQKDPSIAFRGDEGHGELLATTDLIKGLQAEQKKQALAADYAASAEGRLTAAQQRQTAALEQARQAAAQSGAQYLAFGNNLDDSKVSLDQWIKSQQEQVKALRDATANALTASDRGLAGGLIQKLMNEGPAGALRLQQLAKGTKEQIDAANRGFRQGLQALNGWEAAGKRIQSRLNAIAAKKYLAKIDADTDPARVALLRLQYDIARMHFSVKVTASTNATVAEAGTSADGGMVPKTGQPYADRHLYMLADGEEIISNRYGQADQYRADRDAGLIPGYADGGTTGSSPAKPGGKKPKASEVLTKQEYRDALAALIDSLKSSLGLTATGPGAEVRAAFKDFAKQIREDGGKVGADFRDLQSRLIKAAVSLDAQKKKLDSLTSSLDDLKQSAASLSSSVQSGFTTDIFSSSYNPFADEDAALSAAGGTPATHSADAILSKGIQQVLQDTQNAQQFAQDIEQLKSKGFTGAALEALANSNNLDMADALNRLSPGALHQANSALNTRAQATKNAGDTVSNAVFGDGIKTLKDSIAETNKAIKNLTTREEALLGALPGKTGAAVANSLNAVSHAASVSAGR